AIVGLDQPCRRRDRLAACRRPDCSELGACGTAALARSWRPMSDSQSRRRWVTLGETIALLALVVSAAGVWLTWKSNGEDKPTKVVEQRQPIPLTLRGKAEHDG